MTCEVRKSFLWTSLCLAATLISPALAKPPSLRWAQDVDNIFLTVSVDCSSNKVLGSKANVFELSCTKKNGESVSVNFNLREAINPSLSNCKSVRGEEDCKLVKFHRHFFDRLTKGEDDLKQQLKPDWSRWKEADEAPTSNDDNYEGVKEVQQISMTQLDTEISKGSVIIADAFFPWCANCIFTRKAFTAAAKKLSSDKHKFVWIDAREDYEASQRFNLTCDHKCGFQVLYPGEEASSIEAKANENDMIALIKAHLNPSVTELSTDADYSQFKQDNPIHALALLKSKDSEEFKALKTAARKLKVNLAVAFATKSLAGFKLPSIQVLGNLSEPRELGVTGNASQLEVGLLAESLPVLDDYSWAKREVYDRLGLPVVHIFVDEKAPDAAGHRGVALELGREFRGRLAFVLFKKADEYMLKDFGLQDRMPALGVANNFSYNSFKAGYEGAWEAGDMRKFLEDLLAGRVPPSYKSEPLPTEAGEAGKVRKVVAKGMAGVLGSAEAPAPAATLLMLYKPWSDRLDKARAALGKLAEALAGVAGVGVGSMDVSKNHFDPTLFGPGDSAGVEVFACLGDGSRPQRHAGAATLKELLQFAARRVPAVKAGWEESVKGRLREMKEAEAAARAAEEARAAARAEEDRRLEETLAQAEKVEVGEAKDGGVVKQVLRAGEGGTPSKGDKVRAHYTGTLLDGTKFDSSRDRGDPFSFTLGQGQVIKCWDQAFATMKKGERAMLTCTAPYAYGDRGSPPKIPAGATLRFDVELLSFGREEL